MLSLCFLCFDSDPPALQQPADGGVGKQRHPSDLRHDQTFLEAPAMHLHVMSVDIYAIHGFKVQLHTCRPSDSATIHIPVLCKDLISTVHITLRSACHFQKKRNAEKKSVPLGITGASEARGSPVLLSYRILLARISMCGVTATTIVTYSAKRTFVLA